MKAIKSKKGQMSSLYSWVLIILMTGLLMGVILAVMQKMSQTGGVNGTTAEDSLNDSTTAISSIASDWLPVIIVVAVAAIILYLVMRFGGEGKRQ